MVELCFEIYETRDKVNSVLEVKDGKGHVHAWVVCRQLAPRKACMQSVCELAGESKN